MENCAQSGDPAVGISEVVQKRVREGAPISGAEVFSAQDNWQLEPHVCRVCFGRLVSRPAFGLLREYRCTNCETTSQHTDASVACCCGIKVRKRNSTGRHGGVMIDAGIRCIVNPEKSPAFPAAYVASEVVKVKRT
jgi:hypothetical protein